MIEQFGIYPDMDEAVYHRDPFVGGSLSSTGAKTILESPAVFRWRRDNPVFKDEFDFGRAAHAHALGVGAPIDVLDFDDWRRKDAKAARDESRTADHTPLLAKDWEIVRNMARALRRHPLAGHLLGTGGLAEQSIFWPHSSGATLRTRLDWLPFKPERGRLILPDYKTSVNADPRAFGKSVANFGYHQQAAWIIDGMETLWGVENPAVVFIVQEKSPPYLVSVCELDAEALAIGRERNERAIRIYLDCMESGVWPGYPEEVHAIALPKWATFSHQEEYSNDNDQF